MRSLLFAFFWCCAAVPVAAQPATTDTSRVFVQADSLVSGTRAGQRIQELFRNVRVRQDSTIVTSRHALRYLSERVIRFDENVVIYERGDTLRADTVRYNQQTEVGYARGNVHLTDGAVDVYAPRAIYYTNAKRAVFPDSVTLVDSTRTLRSSSGVYFSEEERAAFDGHVTSRDPQTYLRADSLVYDRTGNRSTAWGNVFIRRTGDNAPSADSTADLTYLWGRYAYNDEPKNFSRVRGNALLVRVRRDSTGAPTDTLAVAAHRLVATRTDTLRRLVAVDSVRIWQPKLAATADSVVYDRIPAPDSTQPPDEETRLFQTPNVWFRNAQVHGDSIRVVARNRSLDTVFVRRKAFAGQRDTTLSKIQQLQGQTITARFANDSLRQIVARPTAEAIRYMAAADGTLQGAAKVSGDRIVLRFRTGTLQRASVIGGTQSRYYKPALIPEPFRLSNYRWTPEARPTRGALLRRFRERPLPAPPDTTRTPADTAQTAPQALTAAP